MPKKELEIKCMKYALKNVTAYLPDLVTEKNIKEYIEAIEDDDNNNEMLLLIRYCIKQAKIDVINDIPITSDYIKNLVDKLKRNI